ncbi:MAG: hypothetical protein ABIC04_01685 [Nanoarchaeota archaeon]
MKLKCFFIVLLIFASLGGINSLGRFYVSEPLRSGMESEMYFTVRNPTNDNLEDVNVKVYIYDLGLRLTSQKFDINDGDHKVARIYWIVPDYVRKSTYLSKVTVGNDHYKDSKHIFLTIN